ncbi:MAG: EAL domain-containing protein [Thermoleophilia bacterium]|nr:EAL domain-containing protein [Thermoleophilia bacterium]
MAEYLHGTIGRALGALTLALLGGIVVVTVLPELAVPLEPGEAPWWLVGVAFMFAEAFVHLTRGRVSVVALSPHAAILGVALFLLDPAGLFAAQLAGVVIVLAAAGVGRHEAVVRLATTTGITALALALFLAIGAVADLSGPVGWIAAGVAVTVATAAPLAIALLFRRADEEHQNEISWHVNWLMVLGAVASVAVSIVVLELIRLGRPSLALLLILPFVSYAAAIWATTSEHRRLVSFRHLADAIRRAHEAPSRDESVLELLEAPRALVGADVAWIALLLRNGSESVQVASTGPEGVSPLRSCTLRRDRAAGVRAEVDREGTREVLGSDAADGLHGLMGDLGLRRAISVMENPEDALARMHELRSLGLSLALDDFGTGHSSLTHLRGFPIDTLKIARDFVVGLPDSPVDAAFFETIVSLGRSLGLEVIAEGIESGAQANAIRELGCSLAQGFHFGHPLAPMGLTSVLSSARPLDQILRVA